MSKRQRKKEIRQKAEQQRWLDAHNAAKYKETKDDTRLANEAL